MTTLQPTPGQTIGPFFRYGLEIENGGQLVAADAADAVQLTGFITDANGDGVPDALIEIWQADADGAVSTTEGSLLRDAFTGWGRVHTTDDGGFSFTTIEPGTGFFAVLIFARGLTDRLHSRIYLPEATDEFLESLPADERATLVATRTADGLRHDIRLQGEGETVFLAYR